VAQWAACSHRYFGRPKHDRKQQI